MLGRLARCPYCTVHWLCGGVSWYFLGVSPLIEPWAWAVLTMSMVALCAIVMGLAIRLLLMGEHELETLRARRDELEDALRALLDNTTPQ